MCKHCERLVEDVEHKELVHRFMEVTAEKVNRGLRERGYPHRVTADMLEIKVEMNLPPMPNPSWVESRAVNNLIFNTLDRIHK